MRILVAGGAGYIGSHTCLVLLEAGHEVVVADNLCNSKTESLRRVEELPGKSIVFYEVDVTDEALVEQIFAEQQIDGVIHFAGLKAVPEYEKSGINAALVNAVLCFYNEELLVVGLVWNYINSIAFPNFFNVFFKKTF